MTVASRIVSGTLIVGGSLLAGCAARGAPPTDVAVAPGWTVSADRPVLAAGTLRARALWNDPSVVRAGGRYVMYLTTSVEQPFKPPVLPFRAVSTDGNTWRLDPATPLLTPVAPFASIETPSVVAFNGRWHMFFTGVFTQPSPSPMAVGHAVSSDGVRWTIDRPLLLAATAKAGDWNAYLVAEPGAVVRGDRLLVYFSAVGARHGDGPPQSQVIGLISSTDGTHYSAPRVILSQSAAFAASRGYAGYSSPAAVVIAGTVHLFFSVAHFQSGGSPEWRQVAIAEAVSPDGEQPFVERPAVLTLASTRWTGGEILAPAPLLDGSRLLLWFAGHVAVDQLAPLVQRNFSGPEFGIGRAVRTVGKFATQDITGSQTGAVQ